MANGKLRTGTNILLALWLVAISFITGLPAGLAQSETDAAAPPETTTTVDCTVDFQFGQQVTFTVYASSDTVIEQIHLFFRPVNEAEARSATMDIV